jgi:hypothetical protein
VLVSSIAEHRVRMAGAVGSALCVAYFYSIDRFLFSSSHFSKIFRYLLMALDRRVAWLSLAVTVIAMLWHRPAPVLRAADFLGRRPVKVALATVMFFSVGAVVIYHAYPLSMDEYAAVFQSEIFASGKLAAQLPGNLIDWLIVRGFNGSFIVGSPETGRVVGAYWPGFALLLAPFQLFGVPWLCNALLSGAAIYLIHWITKEITADRRAAGWAVLFTLGSGVFVAEGISYYSMQAHLTANLLFVALLVRPSAYRALAAGLVGSLALILHNPVPHVLFAIPWIAAMVIRRDRLRYVPPLIAGYLPGIAVGFAWLTLRSDLANAGTDIAAASVASSAFAWPDSILFNARAAALVKMWVWAVPCLFVYALLGVATYRSDPRVRLLTLSGIFTFMGYLFVRFDQGHGWGYRYFHSAWGIVPILAGCAMSRSPQSNPRLATFAGATAILGLVIIIPVQLRQIEGFISQHLAQLAPPKRPGNNVYFIHPLGGFYVADMVQFDPMLRRQDLLLVSHGAVLDAAMIQRNWPNAAKLSSNPAADQWYVGVEDQRQFVPAHIPR